MKVPFYIMIPRPDPREPLVAATTVYADTYPEAMRLGADWIEQKQAEALADGTRLVIPKGVNVDAKSGYLKAVPEPST